MISIQELHRVSLGRILEAVRLHKDIPLSTVASNIGVHQATVRSWELSKPFIVQLRPDVDKDAPNICKFEINKHRSGYIGAWLDALDIPKDQHEWFVFNACRADYYQYLTPFGFNEETTRMMTTALALGMVDKFHAVVSPYSIGQSGISNEILKQIPTLPALVIHLPIAELQ